MAKTTRRVGVVLFQLGGPDTLAAIEPFLYNLFCDPDIIDFPFARIGRKPLAKLISTTRARKVQHHYATIGGGSPIRRFTERQARALEAELAHQGLDARCLVAMRYWHPFTSEAIAELKAAAMRRGYPAALVSAVFLNHNGIESERVAAPVPRRRSRAQRRSLLPASDVFRCGDRKD
jgi:ferrochelatase